MASPTPAPGKGQHKFQAPKGTRDFYPADMAVRRHIENVWRQTSINHGFDEVEGPTFEHLELYTHKSGPGIVSEIFGVFSGKDEAERAELQKTGRAPYALRPEFTPTLARMVAARADALPKPIKWFAIPSHFRAERPQRGRLREFMQWNVDFIGDESPAADAEVVAVAVGALEKLGLRPKKDLIVAYSNRQYVHEILAQSFGVPESNFEALLLLMDEGKKLDLAEFDRRAQGFGISQEQSEYFSMVAGVRPLQGANRWFKDEKWFGPLNEALRAVGMNEWCDFRPGIVRGLAYYTGTVFEIIAEGERAIAGGGRYDKLIESFGGPPMPACGFGMGDVVLGLLLKEKGLLKDEDVMRPLSPDAFIISSGAEVAEKAFRPLVAKLRRAGLHVRHSYKSTKNIGKLLGEADKAHSRFAVILDDALSGGVVKLKDLRGGEQREIKLDDLEAALRGGKRE
jgi:histidyl-tRNA synthetase